MNGQPIKKNRSHQFVYDEGDTEEETGVPVDVSGVHR